MAELVRVPDLPPDFEVACTGDWHKGSRAFHDGALAQLIDWLRGAPNRYMIFTGDAIEGKPVRHPHFDPAALEPTQQTIGLQYDAVREVVAPVKDRILAWGVGNHDIYLSTDVDLVRSHITRPLGIEDRQGGYQTWIDLGWFRVFAYHGRASLPRGAKDPIQRAANRAAWLVNRMAPLAGDCAVMLMGHVHHLMVQAPIEQYALMTRGAEVRARYFREPAQSVVTHDHTGAEDTRVYIPPTSRWYGCVGTLRRSGGFGWVDYAEVAGFPPEPIGWLKLVVRGGQPVAIEKVVV